MVEEVYLLAKLNLIQITTVVDIEKSLCSQARRQAQLAQQESLYNELNGKHKQSRIDYINANLEQIVQGKLAKQTKSGLVDLSNANFNIDEYREQIRQDMLSKIADVPRSELSHRFYVEAPYISPDCLQEYHLPQLDSSSLDALKVAVYDDFWQKGYYLTDGLKFGGHFLVYDSDPMMFHSKFIVICAPTAREFDNFNANYVQAYGRLGKNVRKNVLLASWATIEEGNDVSLAKSIRYTHVQWKPVDIWTFL